MTIKTNTLDYIMLKQLKTINNVLFYGVLKNIFYVIHTIKRRNSMCVVYVINVIYLDRQFTSVISIPFML